MTELGSVAESNPPRSRLVSVTLFVIFWGCIGYALGTLILLGPVRWYVDKVRAAQMGTPVETAGVIVAIIILLILSALLTRLALVVTRQSTAGRIIVPIVVFASAAAAYALWMHPALLSRGYVPSDTNAHFVFGPYPDEAHLRDLKAKGFTVVSLLHPAVVPFEPSLLKEETENARKVGIPMLSIPMLPWVSDNNAALEQVKELARDHSRRYYVHCYLGKDRVQLVRRVVESIEGGSTLSLTEHRSLQDMKAFERGRIYELGKVGYLIPYPTAEEMAGYLVSGEIRQVVALLDPDNPEEKERIDEEARALKAVALPYEVIPVPQATYDPARAVEIVAKLKTLPRPIAVHAFFSPETGKAKWAEGVLATFKSGQKALPASLFAEPLSRGAMTVVGSRVVVGPEPSASEVRRLWNSGIRQFIALGYSMPPAPLSEEETAAEWDRAGNPDEALDLIGHGNTVYVFSTNEEALEDVRDALD